MKRKCKERNEKIFERMRKGEVRGGGVRVGGRRGGGGGGRRGGKCLFFSVI